MQAGNCFKTQEFNKKKEQGCLVGKRTLCKGVRLRFWMRTLPVAAIWRDLTNKHIIIKYLLIV